MEAQPRKPVFALTLAMIASYGVIAVVVGHVLNLYRMFPVAYHLTVALACLLAIPTTWFAVRARSEHTGTFRALGATVLSGGFIGFVAMACITASMGTWEVPAFLGVPLPRSPVLWLALATMTGSIVAIFGWILLVYGLGKVQRAALSLDAEESLGVPGLGCATVAAACALLVASPDEMPAALAIFVLDMAFLAMLLGRDLRRAAFVKRVFAGKEPTFEVNWDVKPSDLHALTSIGSVAPTAMVVERKVSASYRETARGRGLMLLGGSAAETLAPIWRRVSIATVCLGSSACIFAARAAFLLTDFPL